MVKKMFFKQSILFLTVFAISGGATMFMMYQTSGQQNQIQNTVQTPAEKLINSLLKFNKVDVKAHLDATRIEPTLIQSSVTFNGQADLVDFTNVKINGDLDVHAAGSNVQAGLGYFTNTPEGGETISKLYLDYNQDKFMLNQADLFDFLDMIPTLSNIELPPEIRNLDFAKLTQDVTGMEPQDNFLTDYDGKYVFELNDVIPGVNVYFKSDENYQCEGFKTNIFNYADTNLQINIDLTRMPDETVIQEPQNVEEYQDFKPALNLIAGLQKVFAAKEQTVGLDISLSDINTVDHSNDVKLGTDISFNEAGQISLDATLTEQNRPHNIRLLLKDNKMFLNQRDNNQVDINNVSVKNSFGSHLMNYLGFIIDNGDLAAILDNISTIINDPRFTETVANIKDILSGNIKPAEPAPGEEKPQLDGNALFDILNNLQNLNQWVTQVKVENGKTIVTIDLSVFDQSIKSFDIILNGTADKFEGVQITGLEAMGKSIDISLNTKAFNMFTLTPEQEAKYVELDSIINLLPSVVELAKKNQFLFKINGTVADAAKATTSIESGFQFDLLNKEGYGNALITEPNGFEHKISADMNKYNQFLVTYNTGLKGYLATDNLLQMGGMVADLLLGKDADFNKTFGSLLKTLQATPVYKALKGDIAALIENNAAFKVKDVVVDDSVNITDPNELRPLKELTFSMNTALMGSEGWVDITIVANEFQELSSIEVRNMEMGGNTINMSISIEDYSAKFATDNRLQLYDGYVDFNDMKVLMKLGIKTITFQYYHLKGKLDLNFSLFGMKPFNIESIPMDVQVHNDNGEIEVIASLEVPVDFSLLFIKPFKNKEFYNNTKRTVTFMYCNGYVYGERLDYVNDFIATNYRTVDYKFKATEQNFLDNMKYYMCDFAFTFSDPIMNAINKDKEPGTTTPSDQNIHYDNLLKKFAYTPAADSNSKSRFDIDINIAELLKNPDLGVLNLSLLANSDCTAIDSLKINAMLQIPLSSIGVVINLDMMDLQGQPLSFQRIADLDAEFATKKVSENGSIYVYLHDPSPKKGEPVDRIIETKGETAA